MTREAHQTIYLHNRPMPQQPQQPRFIPKALLSLFCKPPVRPRHTKKLDGYGLFKAVCAQHLGAVHHAKAALPKERAKAVAAVGRRHTTVYQRIATTPSPNPMTPKPPEASTLVFVRERKAESSLSFSPLSRSTYAE